MWYTLGYANTIICTPAHGGRADHPADRTPVLVRLLPCTGQAVRNTIHAFHQRALAALQPQSSRPHTMAVIFNAGVCEALRALLHQRPRTFGKPTSRWTLA